MVIYTQTTQFKAWFDASDRRHNSNVALTNPEGARASDPTLNRSGGWLSGFTDAGGRPAAGAAERPEKYNQVFVRFVLSQQEAEAEGFDLMTEGPSSPGPKIADPSGFGGKLNWPLRGHNGYNMVVNLMGRVTRPYVSECYAADKN